MKCTGTVHAVPSVYLEFDAKGHERVCSWEQRCCLERTDLTVKFCGISGICGYEHSTDFIPAGSAAGSVRIMPKQYIKVGNRMILS